MIIDADLTYEVRVDEICDKLSKRLGHLRHIISPYLKKNQRIIYFKVEVKQDMMYASSCTTYGQRELSVCRSDPHVLFLKHNALVEQ